MCQVLNTKYCIISLNITTTLKFEAIITLILLMEKLCIERCAACVKSHIAPVTIV